MKNFFFLYSFRISRDHLTDSEVVCFFGVFVFVEVVS